VVKRMFHVKHPLPRYFGTPALQRVLPVKANWFHTLRFSR